MAGGLAWVLNLDADLELGAGRSYVRSAKVTAAMRPHVAQLSKSLVGPLDVLLGETVSAGAARGRIGRAFCPTPLARGVLERGGAAPEPAPSFEVLRRVNSRAFASSLGATLPGATFVLSLAAAEAALLEPPPEGDAWRVKFAFGMAGRNQRVLPPGSLAPPDRAFVRAGVAAGGVQVEPHVSIREEYAMHGFLHRDGTLERGSLVRQRCDARGAWVSTERVQGEAHGGLASALEGEVSLVGRALALAGYFGPFGVDAFTYVDRRGHLQLQPRSEINARYSMGFHVGFGPAPAPLR